MNRIDIDILLCPECSGSISKIGTLLKCNNCSKEYEIKNGKIYFVNYITKVKKGNEILDFLRPILKKTGKFYYLLIYLFSPVCPSDFKRKYIDKYIKGNNSVIALNIGSANSKLIENIINLDILPYANVDILADINKLPFKDDTIDSIICEAVLEHVRYPQKVVKECFRVLKKNGTFYVSVPFICGFHASPDDYFRWTEEGLKELMSDFEVIRLEPVGGPTSALLWVFSEWLAIVFSFGNISVRQILFLIFSVLSSPFKFLDIILKKHPSAKNISFSFGMIVRKK